MGNGFDAIVIGSGFGGSVMALRLAEKGDKVLVLERGWILALPLCKRGSWRGIFAVEDRDPSARPTTIPANAGKSPLTPLFQRGGPEHRAVGTG